MPYQKPDVLTERVGLPGSPLGNTSFFIPTVVAKTLGKTTQISRTATVSGDTENITINGQMVKAGDVLNYERVSYSSSTKLTAALGNLPLLSVLSVSTDHTNPFSRMFTEGLDFSVNLSTGVLDFSNAPIIPAPEMDMVSEGTGGSIAAGSYDFAVMSLDANNALSLASATTTLVVASSAATVTVRWGKVQTAAGYKVYAKPTASAVTAFSLVATITSGTTASAVLIAAISAGAFSLPATNGTKHTPSDTDYVYINYLYRVYNYNSPKRYFDTETVQNDYGVGSEAANAALLTIGPVGTGAGAGSMYLVAPEVSTGEITGYQSAIDACESIQELTIMSTANSSDSVAMYLKAHCESMSTPSNAKPRFGVVSTTSAILADTDVSKTTNKILALNGSNRMMFVVTDGGHPMLNQWQNTELGYNSIAGTTNAGTSYDLNVAVDGQWHAIATAGMISALPDPATPATNKQVYGINSGIAGTVKLWNDTRMDAIAAVGGCVLADRFGSLFVRHGLTVSQASVEDSEMSIVLAEAYMSKRLRDNHLQFIGKKLTDLLLEGVKSTTQKTLDGLIQDEIIRSVGTLNVYKDTLKPTWVYVKFLYKPIYPTNVIKFEWGFDIAG